MYCCRFPMDWPGLLGFGSFSLSPHPCHQLPVSPVGRPFFIRFHILTSQAMNNSGDGSLGILVTNGGAYGVRRTGNRFVWGTTRPAPSRTRRLTTTVMERRPSQPSPRLSSPSPFPPAVARAVPDSLRHREQRREKDLRKLCGEASRALWYVSSATSSALVCPGPRTDDACPCFR